LRGGLTTIHHLAIDALSNSLRVILSAGKIANIALAYAMREYLPKQAEVADKGTMQTDS
jgi:hypothetical protein